jgi:hypothetical protein
MPCPALPLWFFPRRVSQKRDGLFRGGLIPFIGGNDRMIKRIQVSIEHLELKGAKDGIGVQEL